jgi:hypothetical protein
MANASSEPGAAKRPGRAVIAAALSGAAGFAVWAVLSILPGNSADGDFAVREAWDGDGYWFVGLPLLALASAAAGYIAPRRIWRWPLLIALGQAIAMIALRPTGSNAALAPWAAVVVGIPLVLFLLLFALIAAIVARDGLAPDLLR